MKNFKTKLLGLALAGLILGACSQTGTYETADLMNEQAVANKAGFTMTPFGIGNENAKTYAGTSWETGCVPGNGTFANGDFYESTLTPVLVQWGGQSGTKNSKTGNLTVYNTATKFVFRVNSTAAISDLIINGVSAETGYAANTTGVYEVDLPVNWKAGDDYVFTVEYAGGGPKIEFPQTTYDLVGICTTTTLSAGTTEAICEGSEFTLTATVYSFGAFEGGIIQILDASDAVVASADVTFTNKQVQYSVPTGTAGDYTYSARYVRSTPSFRYQRSVSATTSTVNVIACGDCVYDYESGYVGNTVGANDPGPGNGSNNAWWYAFDVEGPTTQNIYQNSNVIGTATYDAVEGTITISFNAGYSLKEGESESVKWYSYAEGSLPTAGRPTPGHAPNKGTSQTIDTNGDRYYVIHLDVQFCNSAD